MQKIIPNLWFDTEAKEAVEFYVSTFENGSKVHDLTVIKDTPSGDCDFLQFELLGYEFMAISAGPLFKINPSISFFVNCSTTEEVDILYTKLSQGGKPLMPLDKYPFSERYGWIQDKYGVSWQIMHNKTKFKQRIVPSLMFTKNNVGKAEEAMRYWTGLFKKTKIKDVWRYEKGESLVDKPGTIKYASFELEGQEFAIMESAMEHKFTFNEAVSLLVNCTDQKEIDYYWQLSADPESEQCGWLKDKFGVSWQINPKVMDTYLKDKDPEKVKRVTEAFLEMKKFDIAELEKAYKGK